MFRRPLRVRDAAAVAALTALVVALPSLPNGFTYDDVWIVQNHPVVSAPGSITKLLTSTFWPATDGVGALWRPVTLAGFAAQWAVGAGSPLAFHAVTIGLSAAVAGLLTAVTGALFGPVVALLAGLLFAVHPVHVEVTATVVGQAELWAAVAYLAGIWAAWRASAGAPGWWTMLVVAAMVVGLGAKEHVITLPAAIPLAWWWRAARDGRALRAVARPQAVVLLASLVMALGYLLVRRQILGDAASAGGGLATGLDPTSALQRFAVMLPLSLRWLELLFVPVRLSADYSPRHVIPDPGFGLLHVLALTAWVAVGVGAWRVRRLVPAAAFGAGLFAVTVAIVSNVPVPLEVLLAERLLYLPSAGWALVVGGLGAAWGERVWGVRSHRWPVVVVVGAVVLAFGLRSVARAPVWRSNETLFAQMAREAPNSFRTHWALGAEALARGDSVAGEREWREAVRLNPDHPQLLDDLGQLYARSGFWEPAVPLLERAVQLDSTRLGTALLLATAMSHVGRAGDGLDVLQAMERLHDGGPALRMVRADVLRRSGDAAAGLAAAREALARDSTNWRIWVFAAETANQAGECLAVAELAAGARRHAEAGALGVLEEMLAAVVNRKGPCNTPP